MIISVFKCLMNSWWVMVWIMQRNIGTYHILASLRRISICSIHLGHSLFLSPFYGIVLYIEEGKFVVFTWVLMQAFLIRSDTGHYPVEQV